MQEVLVNHLIKLAQEKGVVRFNRYGLDMTIAADWEEKAHTNQPSHPDKSFEHPHHMFWL